MIDRRGALTILALSGTTLRAKSPDHITWVANVLKRMETIETGMTREALLTVFTTEGGLSTVSHRTYVSRDCPYFKVDVDFEAAGKNASPRDRIVKISRPSSADPEARIKRLQHKGATDAPIHHSLREDYPIDIALRRC